MKNFPIIDKETGREYWISRSVAVVMFVYGYDKFRNEYILAEQRGPGTPDPEFVGCWCLPCGYVDFDETIEEAASREVFEETGVRIDSYDWYLYDFNSDPKSDKRQNITFRLWTTCKDFIEDTKLTAKHSELDEVSDLKWIPIDEINNYKWAFNHLNLLKDYYVFDT